MDEDDIETEYASDLAEARLTDSLNDTGEESDATPEATRGEKPINIFSAFLFAAFIFVFFDAPQYIIDFIGLGLLSMLNSVIAAFGWLTIYIWLSANGRSLLGARGNNWKLFLGFAVGDMIPLVPGLSGFVITYAIRDRAGKIANKIPGGTLVKATT